jgi:hypothetical protein
MAAAKRSNLSIEKIRRLAHTFGDLTRSANENVVEGE